MQIRGGVVLERMWSWRVVASGGNARPGAGDELVEAQLETLKGIWTACVCLSLGLWTLALPVVAHCDQNCQGIGGREGLRCS